MIFPCISNAQTIQYWWLLSSSLHCHHFYPGDISLQNDTVQLGHWLFFLNLFINSLPTPHLSLDHFLRLLHFFVCLFVWWPAGIYRFGIATSSIYAFSLSHISYALALLLVTPFHCLVHAFLTAQSCVMLVFWYIMIIMLFGVREIISFVTCIRTSCHIS